MKSIECHFCCKGSHNQNNSKRWFNEGKKRGIMGVVLPAFVFDVTQIEM